MFTPVIFSRFSFHVKDWTNDDFVAQCALFFLAGFEPTSKIMSFMSYELTVNPDIQKRLYDEVFALQQELNGADLDYASISKMRYMDMVVSETLRRWPPGPTTERSCSKPYVLEATDGTRVHLKPGDGIWIPVTAIHMDEQNFKNPELFDPERFSDENKSKIKQGSFLPFGMGPSKCT